LTILIQIFSLCAVILTGIVAGSMFGAGLSLYSSRKLPEAAWTRRFQLEDSLFAKVMPPLSQAQLLCLVVSLFLTHGTSQVVWGVATVLSVAVLAISIGLEVPLNKEIQLWTPGAAPAEWMTIRDRWLWNHLYRAIAAVSAFVCVAVATSRYQ
jgi:uncharacterized membrane protein